MKKNFTFLFALFLMFAGTMNVFADAYPFKITTDVENPELYSIQSGRGATHWWTLDEADGTIALTAYESAPTQHWYFTEVTVEGVTYLQLHPYAAEGKAMGYKDTGAGAAKVWAVTPGEEGYDCRWIFDNNGGKAPYGLKASTGSIYLSHYGGGANKMGFWTTGPAGDGGTAMYLNCVKLEPMKPVYDKARAAVNSDIYELHQKYGLIQDTKKFYCNVPQTNEGSLDHLLDNKYDTYFHSAWSASMGKPEKHYLQAEVSVPVKEFSFYFKKRHNNNNNRPVDMTVQGSVDGVTYKDLANINSGFPTSELELAYLSEVITASEACKFFRFVINETNNNALTTGYPFFTYSEFYIFPNNEKVAEKVVLHKAARNVLAVNEFCESAEVLLDAYVTLTNALEKGASTLAKSVADAYNALAEDGLAGKDIAAAKAEFETMVSLTSSNDLFTVVKDGASLVANNRYLIVAKNEQATFALSAQGSDVTGKTPFRLPVGVTDKAGVVVTKCAVSLEDTENLPYMIALESAGEGLWKLKDVVNGAYLNWTEKRSLSLDEEGAVWTISIEENGEAVIKIADKDRTIRFSEEGERFACYATGQLPVMLYEDAAANEFLVAYANLCALTETCSSMWMIPAVNEKFMAIAETAMAMEPVAFTLSDEELNGATVEIEETIAFALAMDAKYNEFKEQLYVCFDLQDNSTATEKVAAPFAEVVDKYVAYQWSVPATTTADFDDYIAEMKAAATAYILAATAADGFSFNSALLGVESEWNGAVLGKSLAGHLYNLAADAFLGTGNHWGSQASFVENGHQWTVSSEALYDFEWLFDDAENVCAANVGGIALVPCQVGANNTTPVAFAEGEDNGIEQTAEGIYLPRTTALFVALNEEADLADYTLVYDVKFADVDNYTSLFQTTIENNDDGDLFVHQGKLGINRGTPNISYGGTIEADTWHQIVVVGDSGSISTYIDGLHIGTSTIDNSWVIKKDGFFFFLDNDGESTDVELAGIKLWKKALTEAEVAQLNEAASAPTYTVSGPLAHPQDPAAYRYLAYRPGNNAGYADQLAQEHTFTLVGKNLYTIQSYEGKYLAYQEGNAVVQYVNQMDENCYWQFVTDEEFLSKFASASYEAPVNATFAVPSANFCYNDTETKEWTGSASFGGEDANFNAYKENTEAWEMTTELHNMPNGVYRMKVQGFYRQGTSATEADRAAVAATRDNGTEIAPAKFFANDATITVMNILDDAGKNTTSTHGVIYGQYGKAPHGAADASVYFNLGLYEHTLVFVVNDNTIKMGLVKDGGVANDWVVMDNIRLEYLGTQKDVPYFGEVAAIPEGEHYVYYTDAAGNKHYLHAAGEHNWAVVDEPTTILFSTGKGTYAESASHMTSNGFQMSNTMNGDGTGPIATSTNTRDYESQVFYKNAAGKYAIRLTNVNTTSWGAFKFVNINAETLEISAGLPELGDELYLWNIVAKDNVGIQEVEVSEVANRAYYTLNGTLVDAPVKGITIVKTTYTNGKVDVQKIFVK